MKKSTKEASGITLIALVITIIIETASNKLIQGCCNTKIPNSVTSIEEYAFGSCDSLTSIVIPESVTYIDINSFGNSYYPISDTAVYNVVEGLYADTWVQTNKHGNQTINYITE